jgi:hypothetical protein
MPTAAFQGVGVCRINPEPRALHLNDANCSVNQRTAEPCYNLSNQSEVPFIRKMIEITKTQGANSIKNQKPGKS